MTIHVKTEYPIAFDSPDHIMPWGTMRDNSSNLRFNNKLFRLFSFLGRYPKVLDLGCSGGGFVKSCLDKGCIAVGLEGSDYSKKHGRAEWPILGDKSIFTTDITREFHITLNSQPLLFDVVTAWEVMEHLPTERLDIVCKNISDHLEEHGLAILSVSTNEEVINGKTLHLTVQDKDYWLDLFKKNNLIHKEEYSAYFNTQYVRGPKQNAPGSFHVFLSKNPSKAPPCLQVGTLEWCLDRWIMSNRHKALKKSKVIRAFTKPARLLRKIRA